MSELLEFSFKLPAVSEDNGSECLESYLASMAECIVEQTRCKSGDDAVNFLVDSLMRMSSKNNVRPLPEASATEEDCKGWLLEALQNDYAGKLMSKAINKFGPRKR